jgi:molybdopterin converting factor small subunit
MSATPVVQVVVRIFGLRGRDSRLRRMPARLPGGTSVRGLLARLRSQAAADDRLVTVDPEALLVLVNGRPIQYLDGWDTALREGDEIACLLKTAGG